jgi:hypothetical protein
LSRGGRKEEVEMRRALLVGMGAALAVVLIATPALATYTKFVDVDLNHVGQGNNRELSISGKLALDGRRNPTPIPPGGRNCRYDAPIEAQRKNRQGNWVTKGEGTTNNNGVVKILVDDQPGKWRLKKPRHTTEEPEKDCFSAVSNVKRHRHRR